MIAAYWRERTARERILLAAAGGLTAVLVLWQLMLSPLLGERAAAQAAFESADAALMDVRRSLSVLGAVEDTAGVATRTGSLRAVVSNSANQFGLAIARIQPGEEGEISVSLENAQAAALFRWLRDLRDTHGVVVRDASLRRSDRDVVVRARLVLAAGG